MIKNQIKYIYILLLGLLYSQGNFQILNIPSNTRMLSLSNANHALSDLTSSYNSASINAKRKNINFHSHLYPASILYLNTEAVIPFQNHVYAFSYANLNYGNFKDGDSDYSFNSSEFLFKGSIKTTLFEKISFGTSVGYGVNKISNHFTHALFISLGVRSQFNNPRLGFGFSMNNIGAIISSFNNIHEQLPTSCNLSTFYSPQYFPGILLFDIYKTQTSDNLEMRIGIEITVTDYLLLRLGNSSNAFELIDPYSSYFTGMSSGIGIQSKHWNLDLGFFNLETAGIITGLSLLYKQ